MRIGLEFLARVYEDTKLAKVEWSGNTIMDMRYGGRLSKGATYSIGGNAKEKFYMTRYTDGSLEIWVRRRGRTGATEETLACLLPNEVTSIISIEKECPPPVVPAPAKKEGVIDAEPAIAAP